MLTLAPRRLHRRTAACLLLAGFGAGCGTGAAPATTSAAGHGTPADERFDLVLVTIDTVRADHLGCYGYARPTTPVLDALAAESIVFENCLAPIPRTTASHLSLMTGVYPFEHGVVANSAKAPESVKRDRAFDSTPKLHTVAQVLRDAGYATAGFVSAAPVKRVTGLATGFDVWDESEKRRPGSETNRAVASWLREASAPCFLWVHYMDAHGPYSEGMPPEPYASMFSDDEALDAYLADRGQDSGWLVNAYDGALRQLDDAVGELLAALRARPRWDRTVLVVVSDHGQGLGQHGRLGHGSIWNEQLRVPLLVRAPGQRPRRETRLLSVVDVVPTALGLLPGLDAAGFTGQARGRDVLAEGFDERPVFGMSIRKEDSFALTTPRWKYVLRERIEDDLFDRLEDPHELSDVSASHPDVAEGLRAELLATVREQRERGRWFGVREGSTDAPPTDEERRQLEELRALGYAEGEE